jgi:hypothetical protein
VRPARAADPGRVRRGAGPSLAALVTITVPLATVQGRSDVPGEADGFGALDGDDARDLLAAAARHPRDTGGLAGCHREYGPPAVARYVDDWIVSIRDATPLMIHVRDLVAAGQLGEARHLLPVERPYPVDPELAATIGIAS